METKLTVRAEVVAAIKLFAAEGDDRSYICGVNLEIGRRESRLIATDANILGCFRVESEQPDIVGTLKNIIIPTELFKAIKPKGSVEIALGEPVSEGTNVRPVTITWNSMSVSGKTIDGIFPDYRRVIPAEVSGKTAQFDPDLLATFAKAWKTLRGNRSLPAVGIGHNGNEGASLVDIKDPNFLGVIMPLPDGTATVLESAPLWALCDEF